MTIFSKLLSRKLLVTLASIAMVVLGSDLQGPQLFVIGLVAAAYSIGNALGKRPLADEIANSVTTGITLGRSTVTGEEAAQIAAKLQESLKPPPMPTEPSPTTRRTLNPPPPPTILSDS